jgi:hypothetical protein
MLAGLLLFVGLYIFFFAYLYDWHPGQPGLVFAIGVICLIVGGIWLWEVSPRPTAHPSMAGRLGQVLSWTATIIALAILAIFLIVAATTNNTYYAGLFVLTGVVIAAVIWALGRVLRYVLAGT